MPNVSTPSAGRRRTTRRLLLALPAAAIATLALGTSAHAAPSVAATGNAASLAAVGANVTGPVSNTYTVAADPGGASATFDVEGDQFTLPSPGNVIPSFIAATLCNLPAGNLAGAYASIGAVDTAGWRPSLSYASSTRQAGPTEWANTNGDVRSRVGGACPGTSNIGDQTLLSSSVSGDFGYTVTVDVCKDGSNYVLTGTRQGPSGPTPYSVNLGSTANAHLYTVGAIGAAAGSGAVEQAVNLTFTGITDLC